MADPIRVIIVDDHPLMRAGIRSEVEKADDIIVVGEASGGTEALDLVSHLKPDVLLLDVEMPEMSGIEVAQYIQEREMTVQVLALSAHDDEQYIFGLLEGGAAGYMIKEEVPETILDAIRGVAHGEEGWLSRRVMAKVMKRRRTKVTPEEDTSDLLSERERDVLRLLAQGFDNHQIGETLFISESTVKSHCNNIYSKLNVKNRVQAAAWAWQHGFTDQNDSK